MTKTILVATILLFMLKISSAQPYLQKGINQLNMGFGLSNRGVPVYFGFDHGVSPDITLGLEASFRNYREDYKQTHYNHNIIGISGNGNYHFNRVLDIPSQFDFYAGLNIGFYHWSSPNNYYGNYNSGLGLGAQIGGRYFFSSKAGLNVEFGGSNTFSSGKIGLTFKI